MIAESELPITVEIVQPNKGDRIVEDANFGTYRLDCLVREGNFLKIQPVTGSPDQVCWVVKLDSGKQGFFDPSICKITERAAASVLVEEVKPVLVEVVAKEILLPFDHEIPDKEKGDENYTPDYFIEACRNFLGWFDLDPFSNAIAQKLVQAKTFWTKADNALTKDWTPYLKKFVNPPYSQGLIGKCIDKILEFCAIGETILVANSSTSAKWFQRCKDASSAYLNPSKRLPFYNPYREIQYLNGTKKRSGNEYDQTVFYFGDRPLEFAKAMEHLGSCSIPIKKSSCLPTLTISEASEPLALQPETLGKSQVLPTSISTQTRKKSINHTSLKSRSIVISENITHQKELIYSLVDSHVQELASQESGTDLTIQNPSFGMNTPELLTRENLDSSSLKIPQDYSKENSISEWAKSSRTFPESGIWESGQFWQQDTLDLPKLESGCLSLPTLTTGLGATRNAGATSCETWLKDKKHQFIQPTQALSIEMMCLLFGFPIDWVKCLSNATKDRLGEQQPESCLVEQSISIAPQLQLSESCTCTEFSVNNIDASSSARLQFLLEQRDRLISSGACPDGVWINCGKVPNRDFKQAVWKSSTPRKEWGDKKSCYIGKFGKEEHLSAIAQHKAGQELRKIEREIRKLQKS